MFEYQNYVDFLNDELVRRSSVNRAYSLRAYAKSLGLSPGELSEVLRGVRKLTIKSALKISKAMGLTSSETKHLFSLIEQAETSNYHKEGGVNLLDEKNSSHRQHLINNDQFDVVSEWYHFAILNLVDCKDFEWSFTYIAKKLNIKAFEVKTAIDKMVNVGLIKKIVHKDGRFTYKVSNEFVLSNDGIPSKAIKNYHRQILNKAIESLEIQHIKERDITGIGLVLDMKDLPAIKKDIAEFQNMMIEKYAKGKKQRVYQLEVALFALSEE